MGVCKAGEIKRWLLAFVLVTLMLLQQQQRHSFGEAAQKSESLNELAEDCEPDQFYNALEMRCENCSEVMRLFEPASFQQPQESATNNWAQFGGGGNNDATTILIAAPNSNQNKPAEPRASQQQQQQFMRLAQRLPQLNGNKSRAASSGGVATLTPSASAAVAGGGGGSRAPVARPRPGNTGGDSVLSRFVMKSALSGNRESAPNTPPAGDDDAEPPASHLADGAPLPDEQVGELPLVLVANNELDELATRRASELAGRQAAAMKWARVWQKLLTRFVHSEELGQLNLPETLRQCKQMQNLTACQMWSNLCVLNMYAHTSDSALGRRAPAPASSGTSQLRSSSRQRAGTNLAELHELDAAAAAAASLKSSWQKCPRFGLASICNSLRDWHQFDKQQAQLDLNNIFADEQEANALAEEPVAKVAPLSLILQLNQPIQLLAYKYALSGQLLEVNQFNLNDLRRSFCVTSSNQLSLEEKLKFTENLNLFLDNNYLSLDEHREQDELLGQLRVGQNVRLSCKFSPLEANLFASMHANQTQFVDLFIAQASSSGAMSLRPVPILIENLLFNQQLVNLRHAQDPSRWKLVHRFFSQAALKLETRNARDFEDEVLIYGKELNLELNFKRQHDKGLVLNSILLRLSYDFLPLVRATLRRQLQAQASANENSSEPAPQLKLKLDDSFRKASHETQLHVSQTLLDMLTYKKDFDLLLTILCLISCIWSLIKTYNVQKFQGFIKLDIYSLFLFLIISCDLVANLLLIVTLLFSLHLFVSLKLHPLVMSVSQLPVFAPNPELEATLLTNVQLALVFKLIGLVYKLYIRLKADTFFIDWERPRMLTSMQLMNHQAASRSGNETNKPIGRMQQNNNQQQQQQQQQQQVSFWRQYSIVNRWLQMQTMRRLDLTMQLLLFVFAFQCFRLESVATAGASLHLMADASAPSLTFRALTMALVYLLLAAAQLAYRKWLHEPMIRSQMREFTDLCSVSNVSLISMLYPRFGYYIHGRNANGSSECGIAEMNALLEREERDLCSKRGLVPNTDQQTFVLLLPKIINDHYRKLLFRTSGAASNFLSSPPSALDGFQLKSALNLSAFSNGSGAPSSLASAAHHTNQRRSLIETITARNRAVNMFFINYLEHVYKDIDYSIRERKRFETACLLDGQLEGLEDEEHSGGLLGNKLSTRANAQFAGPAGPLATISRRAGATGGAFLMANQAGGLAESGANQARALAIFYLDYNDTFTDLLWLGLEWDLLAMELLTLLNLDLWLGRANLIVTVGLLWLMNRLLKLIYNSCARSNLIVKSMLDEKFLNR